MNNYSFDEITPRRGSLSYKWEASLPEQAHMTPGDMEDVIPMWVADMDFKVAPCIEKALAERVSHGIFGYTHVPEEYFGTVSRWFSEVHGVFFPQEWIMYTTGIVPAISAVLKALALPGEEVLVMTPVYNCFFSSIRNNGLVQVNCPLLRVSLPDGSFTYRMDFDLLRSLCSSPKAKVLLLCNPHNPAGRVWTEDELSLVGKIARENDVIVVSDEIHCEIVSPGTEYVPFARASEENRLSSITLCSPSKSFNTAGLQIGNIITSNPRWRAAIDRAININEICDVNPFGVVGLLAAYSPDGRKWLEGLNKTIWRNYGILVEKLGSLGRDFPIAKLEGTYLAWVDTSILNMSSSEIEVSLLENEHVWVNAGQMYGEDSFIRINLACPLPTLTEGLDRIVRGLGRLRS